jgi:phospholipid N-methyltransferase
LQRINSGSKLISIEINHKFQEQLSQINDSRFNLIRGSAENIETLVNEKVDYIVSGLPFASLPKSIKDAILKQILKKVDQDTVFLQYQYFITNYFDLIKYFKVMMGFTFLNIPPAVYYRCRA